MPVRPSDLADELIAHGQHFVSLDELAERLHVRPSRVYGSIHRAVDAGKLVSVTKGGWVPVPPEYRKQGAPPVSHFIDPMMAHLGHAYYVGFLSAAAIHGASHQAPMVFQVATPALLRHRNIGRSRVQFVRRSQAVHRATQRQLVPTGRINVSTPEVTVLDLVEDPSLGAGISNVATVIGDLISYDLVDVEQMAIDARDYPITVAQRTGHLLDFMSGELDIALGTDPLNHLIADASPPTTPLRSGHPRRGDRDARWRVEVNLDVEHDL